MKYIDTHCHLDHILRKLELVDFEQFRLSNFPENYEASISISCDEKAILPTLELMKSPSVYGAFGIHPQDAAHYNSELEAKILPTMENPKTVAFGEIGLDYHYETDSRLIQIEVFIRQIQLAVKLKKPLIIHTREAEEDTLKIMQDEIPKDWKIHVHCFTSSAGMAEKLLAHFPNLCLGFTGIVTFKNGIELQGIAKVTPLDRLLLETDGPYLAPTPHRGKVAHPGHIPFIAAKIAELKGIAVEAVYLAARENTRKVYGI